MPNYYIGTNCDMHTNADTDTLRTGYDKVIKNNSTALDAQMGTTPVTNTTPNAIGTQWGAFTACGGMVVKTADEVYEIHSTPAQFLKQQWNTAGKWLCDNKANITHAILINFGNNANNDVTDPIWQYLVDNDKNAIRISRPLNTTALRASANLEGAFVMKKVAYTNLVPNGWEAIEGQQIITVNS